MDVWVVVVVLVGVFFGLMLLGLPVALSFIAANLAVMVVHSGTRFFNLIPVGMFGSTNNFILIAVPLFIIMGEVMVRCDFVSLVTDATECIFGKLRSQSALLTVGTGTVLAALSGAPIATGATLGSTLVPRMLKEGYAKWLACGTALGGASLACLIPPSSLAIIIASLAETSPTKVLVGGILPGLLASAGFFLFVILGSKFWPQNYPAEAPKVKYGFKETMRRFALAAPLVIIVFLVIGVIFLGIATATEAAALGAVGSILLAIFYRRMTWRIFFDSFIGTAKMTAMLFLIIASSNIFGRVLTLTGAGQAIIDSIISIPASPYVAVAVMVLFLLIGGCFMDATALIMITVPLFGPAVVALGFDLIWFCVIVLITVGIAGITPPVGMVLYALKGACPAVGMDDVYKGSIPFFTIEMLVTILTIAFPAIALYLPSFITG